jgi:hypothetical protein
MARRAATITQAEYARVLRAAKQIGAPAAQVQMPDGTIVLVPLNWVPGQASVTIPLLENKHSDDEEIDL